VPDVPLVEYPLDPLDESLPLPLDQPDVELEPESLSPEKKDARAEPNAEPLAESLPEPLLLLLVVLLPLLDHEPPEEPE
jgi:hypothetical protein